MESSSIVGFGQTECGEDGAFEALLAAKTEEINRILEKYLPAEEGAQKTVIEAMNYSVRAGGKRLRPMLLWEAFLLCGGREEERAFVEPFLAAVEMIHTYSLVHDDLPSMDNDEFRRGQKTTWAVYGEAIGILAGDGLLNYAFETALKSFAFCAAAGNGGQERCGVLPEGEAGRSFSQDYSERAVAALRKLAVKAGIYGMIGGQTADVEAECRPEAVTEAKVLFIHEHKTAALIQASLAIGAILAGAEPELVNALEKCGYNIGLAFQIRDDILDVEGNSAELGKPVGSDARGGKMTYVTWRGLERAKADAETLTEEAVRILDELGGGRSFLMQLALWLVYRTK